MRLVEVLKCLGLYEQGLIDSAEATLARCLPNCEIFGLLNHAWLRLLIPLKLQSLLLTKTLLHTSEEDIYTFY